MREIIVKSILNKKKKRDAWFLDDYTLNPYEGCSFNCQYCYVRGSKYGVNMEDTLAVKINGDEVLNRQLAFRVKKQQYGIIALASATDPYIGAEKKYSMTERFLRRIHQHRFPVLMITKSTLILRDVELLKSIDAAAIHAADLTGKQLRGSAISFSLSTLDEKIASTLEPGAPSPLQRLQAMKACKDEGLLVGVNAMPMLPFISDSESQIDEIVAAAKQHGADYIFIGGLTLFGDKPADSKTLYRKFLERTHPQLLSSYSKLYGNFFYPPKYYLNELEEKARQICAKYSIRRTIFADDESATQSFG